MLKFFTSDIRRNLTKIICLTAGLSVGFLLVAKIYFEQTYDSFLPDIDRLYRVTESVVENGEYKEYPFTPGATTHGLKDRIPQIEAATHISGLTGKTAIKLDDGRIIDIERIIFADSCLFDVLQTPIIEGNPHQVLEVADMVMIPRSLASKIGGEVIGMRFSNVGFGDDYKMTIGGVYEDFPLNSTTVNAVYLSMNTIGKFAWDGRDNWIGNDRYQGIVRLAKGSEPEDLSDPIMKVLKENVPADAFETVDYKVWLRPLQNSYSSQDGVKRMSWMLGMLAVVLLMCAGLNYLLIVIGQLTHRGKEMAIRKCYGTGRRRIFLLVMGESLFFLIGSLLLAILLAYSLSDLCRHLLGYTPQQLFSTGRVWMVEGVVCIMLLIVTGVIPAWIYCRTPVADAFSSATRRRKFWKLALLSIQFFASALILCLLSITQRQYSMVGNLHLGFDFENIALFMQNGMSDERTSSIMKELAKLPFVEGVSSSNRDLSEPSPGNNIWLEGQFDNQTNIADMEFFNPGMFDVMGIKLTQGRKFNDDDDMDTKTVIVEERFIDVLQNLFGVKDRDVVGQTFYITGHGIESDPNPQVTIVGVVENIRRGGFEYDNVDTRGGVLFPARKPLGWNFVRFTELTPENLKAAQEIINSMKDGEEIYITPYKVRIEEKRDSIRRFGSSVMVVGIVIIIIALIGLIGYVADEVNRRSKEIAIRKVNGTSADKIVKLFCIDILKVALPSLLAGGAVAMIIGRRWLSQFTDRVSLSPLTMLLCVLILTVLVTGVVVINSLRVARSNPVDHLRSE